MKLYQELKDLDLIISELTKELKFSKYKSKALERLNKLIDVRNSYFNVLSSNFYFNSLDTLILSNVILKLKSDGIKIYDHSNIERAFKSVFYDLEYGSSYKYKELESAICTGLDIRNIDNVLENKPKEKIEKAILDMLDILKTDMVWKLKK